MKRIGKKISLILLLILTGIAFAENIDPYESDEKYSYAENVGWINFEAALGDGVQVSSSQVTGKVWGENIGWINLSPTTYGGVINDGNGNLSGYAWGENVGWINFDPDVPGDTSNQYKVSIGPDGTFTGWAWGENIGWLHFNETQNWNVRACVVTLDDLRNFAIYWLQSGGVPADLDANDEMNMDDFAIFSSYWLDFCPNGWLLK